MTLHIALNLMKISSNKIPLLPWKSNRTHFFRNKKINQHSFVFFFDCPSSRIATLLSQHVSTCIAMANDSCQTCSFIRRVDIPRKYHWHIRVKMTASARDYVSTLTFRIVATTKNKQLTRFRCIVGKISQQATTHKCPHTHIRTNSVCMMIFQFLPMEYDSVSSCCQKV